MVSVIIPARNEEKNIEKCLLSVLNQHYEQGRFEVILIDDHSEDNTLAIAQQIAQSYSQLRIISLSEDGMNSHKKAALAKGIALAKGDIIVQTDADCVVLPNWLSAMTGFFDAETGLVSGPVKLSYDNTLFQKVQSLEFMGLNLLGAGSIARGKPNMCNGANIAYRKAVYEEVKGFEGISEVASGDDELLMQKIFLTGKYTIRYACAQAAIVSTPAQNNLASFWRQRVRWVSKSRNYLNRSINIVQLIFFFAILGISLNLTLGIFSSVNTYIAILSLALKYLIDIYLMRKATRFFGEKKLMPILPVLSLLYLIYVPLIGIVGNFTQGYEWKGRKIK